MEVGDIVLLYDDALPRSFWKLARVLELITGRDGKTRGAVVEVPAKNSGTTTLRRPLQLLYPLEVVMISTSKKDSLLNSLLNSPLKIK